MINLCFILQLFGVLFFAMLIILAVGSSNGMAGSVITLISDEFPQTPRWIVAALVCSAGFLIGLVYVTPVSQSFIEPIAS